MKDLKIKVNSETESKEIQINLEQLGFKKLVWGIFVHNSYFIFANCNYYSRDHIENFSDCDYKEITLPELRDLVVLKRNSIDDATHEDKNDPEFKYRLIDNHWYVITEGNPVWRKDSIDLNEAPLFIKPIEKPMKEYLIKSGDGKYLLTHHDSIGAIEIPGGAELYVDLGGVSGFYKNNFKQVWVQGNWEDTVYNSENLNIWNKVPVLWQRHTQPEELPFVDDEPSLNDQYAEIEKVRQSHRTASETADPTIKETLSQRQEQYGSFEDVAMITEQMVDVMRKGYYENLAYNQKMALYMICSKMARIVNGDPNHKDSWHDIAGYATLIDNELESEKDMPF